MKNKKGIIAALLIAYFILANVPLVFAEAEELSVLDRYIEIEAESGIITEGSNITVEEDTSASGGKYIMIPVSSPSSETNSITFNLGEIKRKAFYYDIYFRVRKASTNSPALYYSVNGGSYNSVWPDNTSSWKWCKAGTVSIAKGNATIKFKNYSSRGARIDKIILTTSKTFVPTGIGECPKEVFEEGYVNAYSSEIAEQYPLADKHPRLFVSPDEVDSLRERLENATDTRKTYYNYMLEQVKTSKDCILPSEYTTSNYNTSLLAYIELNAFHHLLYKDTQSASNAINGVINYLNTLEYLYNGNGDGKFFMSVQIDAVETASIVYDWCYYAMTEQQKKDIIHLCITHLSNHEVRWPADSEKAYRNGHAIEANPMCTSFMFSIAVFDEYPDAYNQVGNRIYNEYIPYLNYLYEDSMANQGYYYGVFLRFKNELRFKWILNTIGYGELLSEKQRGIAYQLIYSRRPDGSFMNDGDDSATPGTYYGSAVAALYAASLYRDPLLRQELFRANTSGKTVSSNVSKVDFMILDDPSIGVRDYTHLPLSNWSGMINGVMTAKTGWQEGYKSSDMTVTMKVPQKFTGCHRHLDSGEFEIFYKGALAMDTGSYYSFNSAHCNAYHKQTIAHNCMLIYDPESNASTTSYLGNYPSMGGQWPANQKAFNTLEEVKDSSNDFSKVLGYDWGEDMNKPEYTYLKGDLTLAYTTANSKLKKYTRTFMFNNLFYSSFPGCLIVLDKVQVENGKGEPVENTWLLHSESQPTLSGDNVIIKAYGSANGGQLANTILLPETDKRTVEFVGGSGKEFLVGTKNYKPDTLYAESGKWRTEISYTQPEETEYFLNVLVPAAKGRTPLAVEKLEADGYVGVKIRDRAIFLSTEDEKNNEKLTFSVADEKEFIWQIDGLSEGTWKVCDENGNEVAVKSTADTSGVISFKAAGGKYTLEKISEDYTTKDFSFTANRSDAPSSPIVIYDKNTSHINVKVKNGIPYVNSDVYANATGYAYSTSSTYQKVLNGDYYMKFTKDSRYIESYAPYKRDGIFYCEGETFKENGKFFVPVRALPKLTSISTIYYPEFNILAMNSENPNASDDLIPVSQRPVTVNMLDKYYIDTEENLLVVFADFEMGEERTVKEIGIAAEYEDGSVKFVSRGELRKDGAFGIRLNSVDNIKSDSVVFKGYAIVEENGAERILYDNGIEIGTGGAK